MVTLILLVAMGNLTLRGGVVVSGLLLAAGYAQFFADSMIVSVIGLGGQTLLAIYLLVRWRLTG